MSWPTCRRRGAGPVLSCAPLLMHLLDSIRAIDRRWDRVFCRYENERCDGFHTFFCVHFVFLCQGILSWVEFDSGPSLNPLFQEMIGKVCALVDEGDQWQLKIVAALEHASKTYRWELNRVSVESLVITLVVKRITFVTKSSIRSLSFF